MKEEIMMNRRKKGEYWAVLDLNQRLLPCECKDDIFHSVLRRFQLCLIVVHAIK
jgi:hypothetical protein